MFTIFVSCRYLALKRELEGKDRRLLSAESQVAELQARVTEAINQRKHWEAEYNVSIPKT